ncbi:MAG: hypothetical protein ACM3VZ_01745 [Acidobacteriota bacterium]
MRLKRAYRAALFAACLLGVQSSWAAQVVDVWTFYPAPPFRTDVDKGTGLIADLVSYLNQALAGQYELRLTFLPRARLNMMLKGGARAVVLFVPSFIFGGVDGGDYLWSVPLFADHQELVSRRNKPFEFTGPQSLVGVRFGATLGHVYPLIEKEMASGLIRADQVTGEESLVNMLMANHVDVITIANSTVRYCRQINPAFRDAAVLSRHNLGDFTRHLMFQRGMARTRDDFDRVLRQMSTDPVWIATLAKYGLVPIKTSRTGPAQPAPKRMRP